jgi:hypothetical protein
MALPTTVHSGTTPIQWNYNDATMQTTYHGPFKSSAGNIYGVFTHKDTTDDGPIICKATDPTSSWTADIDSANITLVVPVAMWVHQDGDLLHITTSVGSTEYYYYQFNMATDSMDVDKEAWESGTHGTYGFGGRAHPFGRASTAPVVVIYQGDIDKDMGSSYLRVDAARRTTGGTWTVGHEIITRPDGDVDVTLAGACKGSDGSVHVMCGMNDVGASAISMEARTYSNINGLSTQRSQSPSTYMSTPQVLARDLLSYHDGTRIQIRGYWIDNSASPGDLQYWQMGEDASGDIANMDGTAGNGTLTTGNPWAVGNQPIDVAFSSYLNFSLVIDDDTIYLLYLIDTDQDVWMMSHDAPHGSGDWNTEAEIYDATASTTRMGISANIYNRAGVRVIGYFYSDNDHINYNEYSIDSIPTNLSDVKFPQQSSYIGPFEI